jgi:hypothetical protein
MRTWEPYVRASVTRRTLCYAIMLRTQTTLLGSLAASRGQPRKGRRTRCSAVDEVLEGEVEAPGPNDAFPAGWKAVVCHVLDVSSRSLPNVLLRTLPPQGRGGKAASRHAPAAFEAPDAAAEVPQGVRRLQVAIADPVRQGGQKPLRPDQRRGRSHGHRLAVLAHSNEGALRGTWLRRLRILVLVPLGKKGPVPHRKLGFRTVFRPDLKIGPPAGQRLSRLDSGGNPVQKPGSTIA